MEDEEELIECEYCHRQVKKSQTKTAYFYRENISGYVAGEVCEECIQEFFAECADCGNLIAKSTMAKTDDGLVCEACLTDDYATCSICGKLHRTDDMTWVDFEDEYVCNDCFDENYIYCHDCDSIEPRENAYWVESLNDYICESCYDNNYVTCENCGEIVRYDDAYQNDNGDFYCENCWEEENMEDEEILSYHGNRGNWTPFKTEEDEENPIYMGAEIEIEHKDETTEYEQEAIHVLKENINCYLEHDGSLNYGGFEIVTQPQTYKYFIQNFDKYKKAFDRLIELGYISHNSNNCGLHFHVTAPKENRDDIVSRLWLIVENYREQFEAISRRKGHFRWCHFLSESHPKSAFSGMYKMKGVEKNGDRYLVINNLNAKTIEIRLFRGTLNANTFYADLQFVHNLFTLAYDLNVKLEDITWAKLTEGEYISQYCKESKIFSKKKIKDETDKYLSLETKIDKIANTIYNEFFRKVLRYKREKLLELAKNTNKGSTKISPDYISDFNTVMNALVYCLNITHRIGTRIERKDYSCYFKDDLMEFKRNAKILNMQIDEENINKFEKYYNKLRA